MKIDELKAYTEELQKIITDRTNKIKAALAEIEKDMVFKPLCNAYPDGAEQQELTFKQKRVNRRGKVKIIFDNGFSVERKTLCEAVMFLTGKPESTAHGLSFDRALEYINSNIQPMFNRVKELQIIKKNGTIFSTADESAAI